MAHFDSQTASRLYQGLVVVRLSFEVSSKLDPMYSLKRDIVFTALPYLADTQVVSGESAPVFNADQERGQVAAV